jgi:hypothetical protein
MRNREDQMEITDGKKLSLLALKPLFGGVRSALGAVPVAARIVARTLVTTVVTPLQMSAESVGAANFNIVHHLQMSQWQLMILAIGFSKESKHIGKFPSRPECHCPIEYGRHGRL